MDAKRRTIDEEQHAIVEDITSLGDAFSQYSYLLELSALLPPLSDGEKDACTLVAGCQSQVWLLVTACKDNTVKIKAESDTLIVRGVLFLIVSLLDNRTAEDIETASITFVKETDLKTAFSDERLNGFDSICNTLRTLSRAAANQQEDV